MADNQEGDQNQNDYVALSQEDQEMNSNKSSGFYGDGLVYDDAIEKTVFNNRYKKKYPDDYSIGKRLCCGCRFQVIIFIALIILCFDMSIVLQGLGFLDKVPKHFTCQRTNPETGEQSWQPCKQQQICDEGLPKDQYQPDTSDPEYLDNWVQKYDLLCEPKYKIGLIGSIYFVGVVVTILPVPILADKYGRKWVFCITIAVQIFSQLAMMISTNLYELYVWEFLIGCTFAGRVIVGLSYVIEFLPMNQDDLIFWYLVTFNFLQLMMTIWYQFIDNSWFLLQLLALIMTTIFFLVYVFLVPESSKWSYTQERSDESKRSIEYISRFNGIPERQQEKLKDLQWDFELKDKLSEQPDENQPKTVVEKQDQMVQDQQYIVNIVLLTIQWTVASFSQFTLSFMNKYFEGTIFMNYYLDSASGIVGALVTISTFKLWKIKWSFVISLTIALIGGIFLILFQQDVIGVSWVGAFQTEPCPHPEGSSEERDYYLAKLIPGLVFIAKVGVSAHNQSTYQASFSGVLFPFYKKATAIGICNVVARTVTIFSSLAAELERPWPMILFIGGVTIALISAFFFPSIDEEDEIVEKQKEIDQQWVNRAQSRAQSKKDD